MVLGSTIDLPVEWKVKGAVETSLEVVARHPMALGSCHRRRPAWVDSGGNASAGKRAAYRPPVVPPPNSRPEILQLLG